jgi:hypothetical protein
MFAGIYKNLSVFDVNLVSFLKPLFLLKGQRLTKSWHFLTFPGILLLFSLKFSFLWVNIQSNASIIVSITIHRAILPPCLEVFTSCFSSSFHRPLGSLLLWLQVERDESFCDGPLFRRDATYLVFSVLLLYAAIVFDWSRGQTGSSWLSQPGQHPELGS